MFRVFNISQNLKKWGFSKASPPDITTCWVWYFLKVCNNPLISDSSICLRL